MLNLQKTNIFINIKFFQLKYKNISIYIYTVTPEYFFFFLINREKFDYFNSWSTDNSNNIQNVIHNLILYRWNRVIFRGKGFRVRIFGKKKKITLNFGYSHWTKFKILIFWHFFKLRRQNYLFFSTHNKLFSKLCNKFLVKKVNVYTQRGLRLRKQGVKKRFGKISQYVSSLH